MQRLKQTPFHPRVVELVQGADWRRWGGYQVASCYEMAPDREYYAIRASTALFDVSPLVKFELSGPDAHAFLQRLVCRDIEALQPDRVAYTPWCDHRGLMVDDGIVARLGAERFRLTASRQCDAWLDRVARGFDVKIENVTERYGVLALQGPTSRELLVELVGPEIARLALYQAGSFTLDETELWISRTGYTGDLGYEIWVPCEKGLALWDQVMKIGQRYALMPAGIWALDVARIEAGLIMQDVDYASVLDAELPSQASSPFELGLGWAVQFKKPDFVGREALLKEHNSGETPYRLVSLVVDESTYRQAFQAAGLACCLPVKAWRGIEPVFDGEGTQRGYATCGTWSPTTQKLILLAQVHPQMATPDSQLYVDTVVDRYRHRFGCRVVPTPVFTTARKKMICENV